MICFCRWCDTIQIISLYINSSFQRAIWKGQQKTRLLCWHLYYANWKQSWGETNWVLGIGNVGNFFLSIFLFFFLRKGLFSSLQYWMWWFFCLRLWRRCHPKQSDCDNPHYPHNILADVQPVLSWAKLLHTHASLQNSKWWITSEPYPQNWSLQ